MYASAFATPPRLVYRTFCLAIPETFCEYIKYGIPTFVLNGNLVHFGGFQQHIGFYPTPSGIEAFQGELSAYESAKGSVQFPLDKPMPYNLIGQIVAYRAQEMRNKAVGKKNDTTA